MIYSKEELKSIKVKWQGHKDTAKQRNKITNLTLEDYIHLMTVAGITPDKIGRSSGKYCLGRIGDVGDYTITNCRFITREANELEKVVNGGSSRDMMRGRTKENHSGVASMALKIKSGYESGKYDHVKKAQVESCRVAFKIKSPEGVVFEGVNIKEFCRNNNLNDAAFHRVIRGVSSHHKGWTKP